MFLLAIIISLALETTVTRLDRLRSTRWFEPYARWWRRHLQQGSRGGTLAVLATLLPPLLLVGGLQYFLDQIFWLYSFLLGLLVLIFAMGPCDPRRRLEAYLLARNSGDEAQISATLKGLLPYPAPQGQNARDEAVLDMVFVLTHERMLAIFFWFVLLGPMGAILYRLTSELIRVPPEDANEDYWLTATRLHMVLAWLPAHLSALSFAVMGSFVHALHAWRETSLRDISMLPVCHQYVVRTGRAALQLEQWHGEKAIREAIALSRRSLFAWVTVLALLTLSGQVF